jgi:hypothetical protein
MNEASKTIIMSETEAEVSKLNNFVLSSSLFMHRILQNNSMIWIML